MERKGKVRGGTFQSRSLSSCYLRLNTCCTMHIKCKHQQRSSTHCIKWMDLVTLLFIHNNNIPGVQRAGDTEERTACLRTQQWVSGERASVQSII